MISADEFCDSLAAHDVNYVAGVAASELAGPIARLTEAARYVPAANEGVALALAAGVAMSGRRAAVISQNSGLGNLVNPLTSLVLPYRIPVLMLFGMRGWPDPSADEPQHAVMGRATTGILEALGVPWWEVHSNDEADVLNEAFAGACRKMAGGDAAAILLARDAIGKTGSRAADGDGLRRSDVLQQVRPLLTGRPIVSTTGYTSRDLFATGDAEHHFYMQGSMGHAAAIGLGLASARDPDDPVVVLDGDGAVLMHLGTMSTIGARRPVPLVHLVFDNGCYESTGAQVTTANTTCLTEVALACGYASAVRAENLDTVTTALTRALSGGGPHLVLVPVRPAIGAAPPRASAAIGLPDIHRRFARTIRP